jgi:hypothetical protein
VNSHSRTMTSRGAMSANKRSRHGMIGSRSGCSVSYVLDAAAADARGGNRVSRPRRRSS